MGRVAPARRRALSLIGDLRRRRGFARDVLREPSALAGLDGRERAQVTRLVMGTVAARGLLDRLVAEQVRRPSSLEPRVADALALATFEGLFLSTPARVCVDQGVGLVGSVAPRARGLANAVLRRVLDTWSQPVAEARVLMGRQASGEGEVSSRELCRALGLGAALPDWLARDLVADLGAQGACELGLTLMEPPALHGTVLGCSPAEGLALLEGWGLEPGPTCLMGTYSLVPGHGERTRALVGEGRLLVSDVHGQMVAQLAAPEPGSAILEVGCGHGNKTLRMAQTLAWEAGSMAEVAVDVHGSKVERIPSRLERAGLAAAMDLTCLEADGRDLSAVQGTFERVLVDAPCSGTGTMARHPEIPWSIDPSSLDGTSPGGLLALQGELLAEAATKVAEGGVLLYSTCSVLEREGLGQVERFLEGEGGRGFRPVALAELPGARAIDWTRATEGAHLALGGAALQWVPRAGLGDGHFVAALRRVGSMDKPRASSQTWDGQRLCGWGVPHKKDYMAKK